MGRPKGSKNKPAIIKVKNKKLLLQHLENNNGLIGAAARAVGISRFTFNTYYENDVSFREAVDEIRERAIDKVESSLYNQIQSGNTTATIFYLKCKARDRGYVEKQEMVIDANSTIKIKYVVPDEEQKQLNPIEQNITIKIDDKNIDNK